MSARRTTVAAALSVALLGGAMNALASTSPPGTASPTPTASATPTATSTVDPTTPPTTTSPPPTTTTTTPTTTTPTTPPATTTTSPTPSPTEPIPPLPPASDDFIDQEAAAAFAAATTRLRLASANLAEVEQLLVGSDSRISMSLGQVRRAESAAIVASRRQGALADDVSDARVLLSQAKASAANRVRQVYQDGATGGFGGVLDAVSPADFANRATDLDTVTATSNHAVELVHTLPGQIDDLEAELEVASAERLRAADDADALAAAHADLIRSVDDAARQVGALRTEVDAALAAAKAAIPIDQALAVQRGQESSQLATAIVAASKALADSGGVVEGTGSFVAPATGVINSDYGWRTHPILGYRKLHTGIDFDGADGVVYAADRGVVLMTVWNSAYGYVTVIDHGMSGGRYFATLYAHQAGFYVKPGDVVEKGQPIGAVGSTGMSTGPHLHFEVRLDGVPVNPHPFLGY